MEPTSAAKAVEPGKGGRRKIAVKVVDIFDGKQPAAISYGFVDVVLRTACVIYACAIMPDHVHLVIARHKYSIRQVAKLLKGGATTSLRKYDLDPLAPFSGGPQGRANLPSPLGTPMLEVLDRRRGRHPSLHGLRQ